MWNTTFDEKTKIWKGNDLPSCNPNLSIASVLLDSLNLHGSKIAQINATTGVSITFSDIRIRTIRAAKNLQQREFTKRQIFGFVTTNHDHLAPLIFAAFSLGHTIYPIDPHFSKFEFAQKFQKTQPKVIFCDVKAYDLIVESLKELNYVAKIFTFDGVKGESENVENLFQEVDDELHLIPVSVDGINDIAAIICSSGTTGPSKGVCMSHSMLINAVNAAYNLNPDSKQIWLNVYSIQWFRSLFLLLAGTVNCVMRVFDSENILPARTFEVMEQFKVTRYTASPYQLKRLLHSDAIKTANFSSVQCILLGGYKLPYQIGKAIDDLLPNGTVNNRYGLTELGGSVAIEMPTFNKGSCGKLKNGNMAKIIDEHDQRLGVNEHGEICIKSMSMFSGYFREELLTSEAFDDDGFFFTGDIGYFDEDGDLFIVDRKKDTFKYNNYVVSPSEIEGVLLQSPNISGVCVFSLNDSNGIEVPAAAIVRAKGSEITEDDVHRLINDYFYDRNKLAGGIYFVESIPKTPSGKNLKRKMKEIIVQKLEEKNQSSSF